MLSNCACGNPVEIEAGEDGGLMIVCDNCEEVLLTLSSDREAFEAQWNQAVADRKNIELQFIDRLRGLM